MTAFSFGMENTKENKNYYCIFFTLTGVFLCSFVAQMDSFRSFFICFIYQPAEKEIPFRKSDMGYCHFPRGEKSVSISSQSRTNYINK